MHPGLLVWRPSCWKPEKHTGPSASVGSRWGAKEKANSTSIFVSVMMHRQTHYTHCTDYLGKGFIFSCFWLYFIVFECEKGLMSLHWAHIYIQVDGVAQQEWLETKDRIGFERICLSLCVSSTVSHLRIRENSHDSSVLVSVFAPFFATLFIKCKKKKTEKNAILPGIHMWEKF